MEPENDSLSSGLSMQEYLQILRRRRAIILQAFLLITVVGVIVTLLTKPVYQASGELLVDGGINVNTVDSSNPLAPLMGVGAAQSPQTVIEILQTPQLQNQVMQQIGHQVGFSFGTIPDTSVIQATAEASDPAVAQNAVKTIFDDYIQSDTDQSITSLENSYEFVANKANLYKAQLKAAERQLNAFRKSNNLSDYAQNTAEKVARVSALKSDLQSQKISLAVLQAKIASLQQAYAQQPANNTYSLPATNPRIAEYQAAIRQLRLQFQGLTQPGGLNPHGDAPVLKQINAEIATYNQQIAQQPKLLVPKSSSPNGLRESLRGSLVDLRATLTPLQTQMAQTQANLVQAQADAAKIPDQDQKLGDLTRAVQNASAQAATFGKEQSDLQLRQQAQRPHAHVIQPALPPGAPIRPKKALNILFSCIIGLFVGLCLALLQEFLDDRINTIEDSDRLLGLPSLGFVPALAASENRLLPQMQGSLAAHGASESYRVLRTNVNFSSVDAPLRTLLVASSTPGEGKTTTAVNLAFAMVMDGKKVILLDTDLRRPSVHTLLGLPVSPGLTDVLAGQANVNDVLMQHSQVPGLMAMTAGSLPPNPSELLNSRTFHALLEQLGEQADMIIMDSPPVLAAADAQILAAQADGVVLVVEPGETKKSDAKQTLSLLRHARANVLGVTYNKMKAPTHGSYYYYQNTTPTLHLADGDKKTKAAKALSAAVEAKTE